MKWTNHSASSILSYDVQMASLRLSLDRCDSCIRHCPPWIKPRWMRAGHTSPHPARGVAKGFDGNYMAVSRRGPGDQLRNYVQYQWHVLFGSLPARFRRHKRRMVESFVSVSRTFPFGQVFTRNGKTYTCPLVVYPCVRQSSRAFRWRFVGPESVGCFVESRRRTSSGESAFFSRDCPSPHSWRRWRRFDQDHRIQLTCRSCRLLRRDRRVTRAEGTGKSPRSEKGPGDFATDRTPLKKQKEKGCVGVAFYKQATTNVVETAKENLHCPPPLEKRNSQREKR
jgi:hypothetical protein